MKKKLFLLWMAILSLPLWGQDGKRYAVGEIYDEGGVRGIVVKITDEGRHGLIMSLDEEESPWSVKPGKSKHFFKHLDIPTDATSKDDGMLNMEKVAACIEMHDLTWAHFPPFQWCRNKGEGWYLPAINELIEINKAFHGGRIEKNNAAKKAFNKVLKENGGPSLGNSKQYFSSTEITGGEAYAIYMEKGMFGYGKSERKGTQNTLRAVRKF